MLKNLKEKLKKGITKKKITTIAIFAVAVIIAIIAIVVNQTNEQSSKRKKIIADGELARAMTYDQFEDGDEAVDGTDNVKFSAFFLRDVNNDGYAEKIKGTCKQIGKEDTLYMEVNVQTDGILKNAKIEVDGKNFYLATTAPKDNELKDNYVGTNIKKLEFNDMANGTQKLITGVVRSGDYSYTSSKASAIGSNINNLSRNDNKIIFTGTYVGSDGNEIQINKEINLQTDWYGTTSASISTSNSTYYDIQNRQNEEDGTLTLTAGIRTYENNYQLNIKKNYVEGTIPQLNGYDPISVTSESSTDSFNYDETTRKFTLTREGQVDTTGNITKAISRENTYTLKIVYPLEAYKSLDSTVVTIEIPVMTYYEGYNNTNTEFKNPYKSMTELVESLSNENEVTDEEKKSANIYSEELAQKDIEYAKQNSNYIIAIMHWGDVNSSEISEYQRNITTFLVKNGVDMILGSHPSVVEPMEIIQTEEGKNVLVAYSLGNYISTLKYANADVELILNIQIAKSSDSDKAILQKVDYTPIYVLDNGTKAENRFELTDMKKLAQDYANGDTSRISRKTYDSIISKLEKLQSTVNSK